MDADEIRALFGDTEDQLEKIAQLLAEAHGEELSVILPKFKVKRELRYARLQALLPRWRRWPQEKPPEGWIDVWVCVKVYDEEGDPTRYVMEIDCCSWRANLHDGNPFGEMDYETMDWCPIANVTHWMPCPFPALPLEDE